MLPVPDADTQPWLVGYSLASVVLVDAQARFFVQCKGTPGDIMTMAEKLVPTLCVGMPSATLRVVRSRQRAAERPGGIPTQSVGTSDPTSLLQCHEFLHFCRPYCRAANTQRRPIEASRRANADVRIDTLLRKTNATGSLRSAFC